MSRRLSSEEHRLWSRVARTVRAAPGRSAELAGDEAALAPATTPTAPKSGAGEKSRTVAKRSGPPEDLSGQRRIRRGQSEIDDKLDLHGHTQDTAHRELVAFILQQAASGSRCVLVVTGKGRLGTGILRARLYDWIADPDLRPLIAGYARAHPRHGGEGAVYLLLRSAKR
jgi:DNA-nicking Smr family endonuclease